MPPCGTQDDENMMVLWRRSLYWSSSSVAVLAALVVLVIFERRASPYPLHLGRGEFVRFGRAIFGAVDQVQVTKLLTQLAAIGLVSLTRADLLISVSHAPGGVRGGAETRFP